MKWLSKYKYILLLGFVAFLSIVDLLHPGLPPTHDGEYHLIRFYEFDRAVRSGSFYPRWAQDLNNGYGVPLFNYVYPLPNYIAFSLHMLGISFIDAFKLNMILATFTGAIFMYFWARVFWGEWGGIASSVFYSFSPYHFLDIYIRGSVGEVWALGLFSTFLWAITKFVMEKQLLFLVVSSFSLAAIIFSHNILALMFFPFALSYTILLLIKEKEKRPIISSLVIFFLGISLAAIFWLPAIMERSFVAGLDVFDYRRHFAEVYQLIFPSWGSGFSADPATPGLSLQVGVVNLVVLFISLLFLFFARKRKKNWPSIFMIAWAIFSMYLMLDISQPIWTKITFMQFFQFPWRFLSLVILTSSFLAGGVVFFWRSKPVLILLCFLAILLGFSYAKAPYYLNRDDNYYVSRSNFIDGTNSPGNAFNTIWFNSSLKKTDLFTETIGQSTIVNIAYFPGWQVFVGGKKVKTEVDENGLIKFRGTTKDSIEAKLLATPLRSLSQIVSIVAFLILASLFVKSLHVKIR